MDLDADACDNDHTMTTPGFSRGRLWLTIERRCGTDGR